MIAVRTDTKAAQARLAAVAPRVTARVAEKVAAGAAALRDAVRRNLSGEVLNARSGRLRDSIRVETENSAAGSRARIVSDVPYARIQEYGGRIDIPEIEPVAAKVLAFPFEGRLVFAAHVKAHAVQIPARPYMRAALDEFARSFKAELAAAIAETLV
jgi:phage gpG-like protein